VTDTAGETRYKEIYPSLLEIGPGTGVFTLPGKNAKIYIEPASNTCTLCGNRPLSKWCKHLVSAGRRLGMEITHTGAAPVSLTKLVQVKQRDLKGKSGRKPPRKGDYYREFRDVEVLYSLYGTICGRGRNDRFPFGILSPWARRTTQLEGPVHLVH
jgi:hypothetical protein